MIILSSYIFVGLIFWFYIARRVVDDIKTKHLDWEGSSDDWAFVISASLIIIMFWPAIALIELIK